MFTVTLEQLRNNEACLGGYNRVVRMLQNQAFTEEDKVRRSYIHYNSNIEISLVSICKNQGVDDALWTTRCLDETHNRDLRLFAVWCARQVQHLMTDERSIRAIDVAERFANGEATQEELEEARKGAWKACYNVQNNVESEIKFLHYIAYDVSFSNVSDAAYSAAEDAFFNANDEHTKRTEQTEMFIKMCEGNTPWQVK